MISILRIVMVLESVTFFLAAAAHLGRPISLGFAVLSEPRIVPATIVEGLIAVFLAVAAYAALTAKSWARPAAIAAHVFGIAGVLLGVVALALGRGPRTESNDIYHRVMLAVMTAMLLVFFSRAGKGALAPGGSPRSESPGRAARLQV